MAKLIVTCTSGRGNKYPTFTGSNNLNLTGTITDCEGAIKTVLRKEGGRQKRATEDFSDDMLNCDATFSLGSVDNKTELLKAIDAWLLKTETNGKLIGIEMEVDKINNPIINEEGRSAYWFSNVIITNVVDGESLDTEDDYLQQLNIVQKQSEKGKKEARNNWAQKVLGIAESLLSTEIKFK